MKLATATWIAGSGLFAGAVALAIHQQGSYVIASTICGRAHLPQALLTAFSVGILVLAGLVSWRRFRRSAPALAEEHNGSRRFLAVVAALCAALFLFAVLLQASAALFLPACVG